MGVSRHLAVIGDGATAAAFLAATDARQGDQLTIIGPWVGRLGAGRVYADHGSGDAWRFGYLLDRPNGEMGGGFAGWLAGQWPEQRQEIAAYQPRHLARWHAALSAGDFDAFAAPRALYGRFLSEQSRTRLADLAETGVAIRLVPGIASDIAREGEMFRITLSTGEAIRADRVDVATGGPANQRFGSDAGPTAFTTLHGNERAIAEVLTPGQEVTCLGASPDVLDVLHFLRSVRPDDEMALRVIRGEKAPYLEADPDYRALKDAGRIVEEPGHVDWVYAEAPGQVRVRSRRADGERVERTVPVAINTAGAGEHLAVDLLISGLIAKGWLRLDEGRKGLVVRADLSAEMDGLRYLSSAVRRVGDTPLDGEPTGTAAMARLIRAGAV